MCFTDYSERLENKDDAEGERKKRRRSKFKAETILEIIFQANTVFLAWKIRSRGETDLPNLWLSCD